ncbi:hypothetical protein KXJ69_06285 [Aureisphaera sp. CAU 1614]|uniref:Methyltransferase FkbM domain-containing protein n=1 Tax=Halomarinibacterium sedimenti TaxID=2857106 RepID=A0A9X1FPX8_9FLAO|nr:hypothetical protein [Halomarinibacterium sedimenti]MBW2937707.1 hypothetical protein [Halomarinibacterium sedimenti]
MEEKNYDYIKRIKEKFLVTDASLFRFGSVEDGGYFLRPETLKKSKVLFSGGISSNVEFEFDIFRFNKNIKILMLDPTVSRRKLLFKGFARLFFSKPDKIRYLFNALIFTYLIKSSRCIHKKLFLDINHNILSLVKTTFNIDSEILLKLDIEGSEYDFLDEITKNLDSYSAMVFEFHNMHLKHPAVEDFISKCSTHFNLVYFAENPSGGYDPFKRPKNVEISLERRMDI